MKDYEVEEMQKDLFRDTPVRFLGYANEVGESFRSLVPVNVVRFTYFVASSYVCADAYSKGKQAAQVPWTDSKDSRKNTFRAVIDTLLWQGLASVIIPGFTINRICLISGMTMHRFASSLPLRTRKWTVTAIGMASIPFIIKPIDHSVDYLMEHTFRKWCGVGPVLEEVVVHHTRND